MLRGEEPRVAESTDRYCRKAVDNNATAVHVEWKWHVCMKQRSENETSLRSKPQCPHQGKRAFHKTITTEHPTSKRHAEYRRGVQKKTELDYTSSIVWVRKARRKSSCCAAALTNGPRGLRLPPNWACNAPQRISARAALEELRTALDPAARRRH